MGVANIVAPGQSAGIAATTAMDNYYHQYVGVTVLAVAAIVMVVAMLTVGKFIRPTRPQEQKYIPYEAGSDPVPNFGQSNVRYYLFALLFVMFDVEAVFIFPWALGLESFGAYGLVSMTVFILLLAVGLVYAWRKGILKWA